MVAGRPLEGFSKEKTEYTYDLVDDGSMLVYPEVTAKVSDNSANVTVKTDEKQGKTTVTVEYGDRTTTSQTHTPSSASFNTYSKKSKTYTITYNIPSEYITNKSVEKSNTYQASSYNKQVLNKYNMRTRFEKTFTMTEAEKTAGEKQIDITTSWISGLSTLIVIPTAENVKTGAMITCNHFNPNDFLTIEQVFRKTSQIKIQKRRNSKCLRIKRRQGYYFVLPCFLQSY